MYNLSDIFVISTTNNQFILAFDVCNVWAIGM